jgi:hypothetical protein
MEGDPFEQDGLEYLFGVVYSESGGSAPAFLGRTVNATLL